MLETKDLILDKAKMEDMTDIYENVWSQPFCAKYMFWELTTDFRDVKDRMERTIRYQTQHPYAYFVYLKESQKAIGFANMHICGKEEMEEGGIVLGPDYVSKGYGKQIVNALLNQAFLQLRMKTFYYRCRKENMASIHLAESCGFELVKEEKEISRKDNKECVILLYKKENNAG